MRRYNNSYAILRGVSNYDCPRWRWQLFLCLTWRVSARNYRDHSRRQEGCCGCRFAGDSTATIRHTGDNCGRRSAAATQPITITTHLDEPILCDSPCHCLANDSTAWCHQKTTKIHRVHLCRYAKSNKKCIHQRSAPSPANHWFYDQRNGSATRCYWLRENASLYRSIPTRCSWRKVFHNTHSRNSPNGSAGLSFHRASRQCDCRPFSPDWSWAPRSVAARFEHW